MNLTDDRKCYTSPQFTLLLLPRLVALEPQLPNRHPADSARGLHLHRNLGSGLGTSKTWNIQIFIILFSLIVKSDEPDSHRVTNLIANLARSVASAASASRRRKPPTAPREPPSSPSPYPRPHVDSAGGAPQTRRWPSGCSPHFRPLPRPGIKSAPSTTRKSFVDVCMYVRTYVRRMYVCMYVYPASSSAAYDTGYLHYVSTTARHGYIQEI